MVYKIFEFLHKIHPAKEVHAHCDIPCGIYDPTPAQIAAHTVVRMTSLLDELKASSAEPPFEERKKIISQVSRLTKIKEEHAELIKHEIRIIWGDYFKEEHLKDYPDLHGKVFKIMKLASSAKQNIDLGAANELLAAVQEFAEIFYKTKKLEPVRIPSGYPTGGEIAFHK